MSLQNIIQRLTIMQLTFIECGRAKQKQNKTNDSYDLQKNAINDVLK